MVIGVDVDLTIVDSLTPWLEWYEFKTGHSLELDFKDIHDRSLNLSELMIKHESPTDFWRTKNLYDSLELLSGVKEILTELMKEHEVIFISYCFPEHIDSKLSFLKRNFGTDIKFIDTKHKEYIYLDVFFDDNTSFIDRMIQKNPKTICVQKKTSINQISSNAHFVIDSWEDFDLENFKQDLGIIK